MTKIGESDAARLLAAVLDESGLADHSADGFLIFSNQDLEKAASHLSLIAGQVPPWSRYYLRQVLTGALPASKRLTEAIQGLALVTDGRPAHLAVMKPVELLGDLSQVQPGTVIVGYFSAPCRCPGCPVVILTDGRKLYCGDKCKNRAAYLRRKARFASTS